MKKVDYKRFTALIISLLLMVLFSGCAISSRVTTSAEPTTALATQKPTEAVTTVKPTEPPAEKITEKPTEKLDTVPREHGATIAIKTL